MFEDTNEPEDMFDTTDKVAPQVTAPTDLPPVPPASVAPSPVQEQIAGVSHRGGGFPWKMSLLIIGIFVVIGAAFLLSMKILGSQTPTTPEPPGEVGEVDEVEKVDEGDEVKPEDANVVEEEEEPEVSRKDTDKDGLTDEEEEEYGTSIRTADTDSDGLFDPEEIKTWETDPLNPDTDGDGYLDGEEVDAGYNPNGEGVLREPPTESS